MTVDAYTAAAGLCSIHGMTVAPATIRSWANRGLLTRRGHDQRGRTLYSLDDIYALACRVAA